MQETTHSTHSTTSTHIPNKEQAPPLPEQCTDTSCTDTSCTELSGTAQCAFTVNEKVSARLSDTEMAFSYSYIDRYSRQMVIKEIGPEGQHRIKEARVLVVGAGGLGAPVLMYLAAMGVGCIGVSDSDRVEYSNLNRQVLYKEESVGKSKTEESIEYLSSISSSVEYFIHPKVSCDNIWEIGDGYDIVIDCADSRSLRYLLSDYCRYRHIPYIGGSSLRWEGHVYVLNALCYRCIHPSASKYFSGTCATAGIIGSICGIVGSVMATEALKAVIGLATYDKMFYSNGITNESMNITLRKKECVLCREYQYKTLSQIREIVEEENRKIEREEREDVCMIDRRIDAHKKISDIKIVDIPNKEVLPNKEIDKKTEENTKISLHTQNISEIDWKSVLSYSNLYFIVDIRSTAEHRILSVPNAYLYTLSDIVDSPRTAYDKIKKKAKGRQIVLCCRNGSTSRKFLNIFNAMNIKGGTQAYLKYNMNK